MTRLTTSSVLGEKAMHDITAVMNPLLADVYALYLKTKNYHWHISGVQFKTIHEMFDEHAMQLFAMTDPIAERVRKLGGITLHSIGEIARLQRIKDDDRTDLSARDMLIELCEDNKKLAGFLREAHKVCSEYYDVSSTSLIENWMDETEQRAWFLFETSKQN